MDESILSLPKEGGVPPFHSRVIAIPTREDTLSLMKQEPIPNAWVLSKIPPVLPLQLRLIIYLYWTIGFQFFVVDLPAYVFIYLLAPLFFIHAFVLIYETPEVKSTNLIHSRGFRRGVWMLAFVGITHFLIGRGYQIIGVPGWTEMMIVGIGTFAITSPVIVIGTYYAPNSVWLLMLRMELSIWLIYSGYIFYKLIL